MFPTASLFDNKGMKPVVVMSLEEQLWVQLASAECLRVSLTIL